VIRQHGVYIIGREKPWWRRRRDYHLLSKTGLPVIAGTSHDKNRLQGGIMQ